MLRYRENERSLIEGGFYISRSFCYGEYLGRRGNQDHDIILSQKFSLASCATPPSKDATFNPCNKAPQKSETCVILTFVFGLMFQKMWAMMYAVSSGSLTIGGLDSVSISFNSVCEPFYFSGRG